MKLKLKNRTCKGSLRGYVLVVTIEFILLIFTCCALAQGAGDFSDAIGFLAKEQSLAESYATILKEFGKKDMRVYAQGIELYAKAKAEYDGLIEQLKYNLKAGENLDTSSEFQNKLQTAADRRIAFTVFVSKKVIQSDLNRKNPIAIAAIATVPELIDMLNKVGRSIWQEYCMVVNAQKKEILYQLDELKWKPFQETGNGHTLNQTTMNLYALGFSVTI